MPQRIRSPPILCYVIPKDVYDFAREKAGRGGLLTWRENAMSTERFCMPGLDGFNLVICGTTDASAHPNKIQQQAASTPAFLVLFFPSKATLVGIVRESSDNADIDYFQSFAIFTFLKRHLLVFHL